MYPFKSIKKADHSYDAIERLPIKRVNGRCTRDYRGTRKAIAAAIAFV